MNIFRVKLFTLIFLSGAIFGCSKMLNKSYVKSIEEARDDDEYFVITNEGKKITGSKMKVFANDRGYGYVVLDGKRYKNSDLAALQKKDGYYGRFGYNWAPRIHKGSIEAYETHQTTFSKTLYPEREAKTTYAVILIKNHGPGMAYNTKNLYEMIQDDPQAVTAFNERFGKLNEKTLVDGQYKDLLYVLNAYH